MSLRFKVLHLHLFSVVETQLDAFQTSSIYAKLIQLEMKNETYNLGFILFYFVW